MSQTLAFREELISQIPALQLLMALGYRYLTPDEALAQRGGRLSNVILDDSLQERLQLLNWIEVKGARYTFSASNIQQAIETLKGEMYDGLVSTNERLYELLTLGTSLRQTIKGDTKSYSLRYIDWQNPANNWGARDGGFDLTGATKLTFWAKGEKGGEVITEFKMGGITGEYGDSDSIGMGPVVLTNEWKKYAIDLEGLDLSYISGGFCWSASKMDNPDGFVIFLDEIKYE